MSRKHELPREQSERVRTALQRIMGHDRSQVAAAARLGVSQQTISSVISGKSRAGISLARAIAREFGTDLDTVLRGECTDTLAGPSSLSTVSMERAAEAVRLVELIGWDLCQQFATRIERERRS